MSIANERGAHLAVQPLLQKSVNKHGEFSVKNGGNNVDYPDNNVSDTGEGNKKANYKGNDVLGLEVLNDSVHTANDSAKEDLDKDLGDLGEAFVGFGKR